MSKLHVLAVAAAFGLLATTAASALESHFPTWADAHPDFSISRDGSLPPTAGGLDAKHHGYWPPTDIPTQ